MICPYLKNELCTIYDIRPACCRNFPNTGAGMFCSDANCDSNCAACVDKCCKHLEANSDDAEAIIKVLSVTCSSCKSMYVQKS